MDAAGLRIVQVIPSLWHGGLERMATTLTIALEADPAVERVVVCTSGGDPYLEELHEHGIDVITIPRPFPRPGPLVRAARSLAQVIREEQPHVVHAHNPGAAAAAALGRTLARAGHVAIVSSFHGVLPRRIGRAVRALSFSDLIVGVSPTTTRALVKAGLPAEKTATIFNAVQPQAVRGEAEVRAEFHADGVPLIITVGRYVGEKNQALLLDALALLGRPLRGLVVGYGPREGELRSHAAGLGLAEMVSVTGRRDDTADLIAAADVFALSSSSEALPLVLIEAMSLGTPVVATSVGGIADVVTDGETGLLVPPGDVAALSGAIGRVLGDRALADRLAAGGHRFATEHCSIPAMVAAYRDVYTDAIARRAGARPPT